LETVIEIEEAAMYIYIYIYKRVLEEEPTRGDEKRRCAYEQVI
jgi:hypothetical protein